MKQRRTTFMPALDDAPAARRQVPSWWNTHTPLPNVGGPTRGEEVDRTKEENLDKRDKRRILRIMR